MQIGVSIWKMLRRPKVSLWHSLWDMMGHVVIVKHKRMVSDFLQGRVDYPNLRESLWRNRWRK